MTQPPVEPEPGQSPPPRRGPSRPPVWPYFLTPVAVILGAAAIVVAIIVTDDDQQTAQDPVAMGLETLSTAVEALVEAAESLSLAAESLSVPGGLAPSEAGAPVTLRDALSGYASALDLDSERFAECIEDAAPRDAVNDHLQRGLALGVNGTPTFFVNNKLVSGAQPVSIFLEIIAAELAGSPTSVEEYSEAIQVLASTDPPRFAILSERPDILGAPIEGSPDAGVVVVEFSDFQCPFCQRWYFDALPEIRERVGEAVAIVFLHFPLVQIHPNAASAHVAAQCAAAQGKFWEMHDLLFERQNEWSALPNVN